MRMVRMAVFTLGLIAVFGISGCQTSPAKGKLQVLYSGNLRGSYKPCGCHTPKGGLARWATFINRNGDSDAAHLVVDAGNYVDRQGSGGCSNKCQFMLTSYKDLHYDVLNLGNQEVWMGYKTLTDLIDTTKRTDFISANLLDLKTKKPLAKPYVIKDYGTLRVGVIGLINEGDFPKGTSLLDTTRLMIMPHREAAKKYIPSLARKVDAVVLLCGLSSVQLDTLLALVPEVDLVISTGGIKTGENVSQIGKTRVFGSGSSGYNGHYAMLEFNPAWKDSINFISFQDGLTDTYEEKGEWTERLAAFEAQPAGAGITSSKPTR